MRETYITFDNISLKQNFGTLMGSKISPILASYVKDDFMNTVIPKQTINLRFIRKYVDHIILALLQDELVHHKNRKL